MKSREISFRLLIFSILCVHVFGQGAADGGGLTGRWNMPYLASAWSDGAKGYSEQGIATMTVTGDSARMVFVSGETMTGSVRGRVFSTHGEYTMKFRNRLVNATYFGTITLSEDGNAIDENIRYCIPGYKGQPTREVIRVGQRAP